MANSCYPSSNSCEASLMPVRANCFSKAQSPLAGHGKAISKVMSAPERKTRLKGQNRCAVCYPDYSWAYLFGADTWKLARQQSKLKPAWNPPSMWQTACHGMHVMSPAGKVPVTSVPSQLKIMPGEDVLGGL